MTSIRLRLINRCESILYHSVKKVAELLRGGEAEPHSLNNLADRGVVGVNYCGSQAQVDHSVMLSGFGQQINEFNRSAAVSNVPVGIANGQALSGFQNNVSHSISNPRLPVQNFDYEWQQVLSLGKKSTGEK